MTRLMQISVFVMLAGFVLVPCARLNAADYPDPARFEKTVREFEAADKKQPPPRGAIVCIGSSSMRGWHAEIHKDLAPLTIIPRGFGGSNMNEALHFVDRIVINYAPRAVVLYEGDNDIAQGVAPRVIAEKFQTFVARIHKQLPECRIYVISIKPSIRRWKQWSQMKEANSLIQSTCAKDKRLVYVDVATPMLDDQGTPRKEIFQPDNLHMTRAGYVIWRNVLRPILLKHEQAREASTKQGQAESNK